MPGLRLDLGIEEALFCGDQRAPAIHVDAATFEDDLAIDQRQLELLRGAHGDEIVLFQSLYLATR
jgi:hypothetical protein